MKKRHRYCEGLLGSFTAKQFKMKDNKIICLNILNKRLLENTNYSVLELWNLNDVDRLVKKVATKLNITMFYASEELKNILKNNKEFWRKDYEKIIDEIDK